MSRKRPEIVVVGAESRESLSIADEFRECLRELEAEDDEIPVVPVELMDPNVARIYSKTNRAKVNMRTILKARYMYLSGFCFFQI